LPVLPGVKELIASGHFTGASDRNWESYGTDIKLADGAGAEQRILVTDPQTSGGLLACVAPEAVDRVLAAFRQAGFQRAAAIGVMTDRESERSRVQFVG
jgi:selenide,water dikinase